jgi:alanine dehydrogenase
MIIGVPKEIKDGEGRVAIVPAGVEQLVREGHEVVIEAGAGAGAGIADAHFAAAGAALLPDAAAVWERAGLLMKVKEPLPPEYPLMRRGQLLFCFLHLAPLPALTGELLDRGVRAFAFETIQLPDGSLPLLVPMSQVAGKLATQTAAAFLQAERGGRGVLLGGVPGVRRGRVAVLGGGTAGTEAARVACGMGAEVTVLDSSGARLARLADLFGDRVTTLVSGPRAVREAAAWCDALIGAVLVPGARAPRLVTRETLRGMGRGSVLVDVSIDQGGVAETSRPTSHSAPVFVEEGVLHYCVPNMPGSVPVTSTYALAAATLPWCARLATPGLPGLLGRDPALARGAATWDGALLCGPVAEAQGRPCAPLPEALGR